MSEKVVKELEGRVAKLDLELTVKRKKADKRSYLFNRALVLLMFLPVLVAKDKFDVFTTALVIALWIGIATMLEVQLHHKDFTIGMITGIQSIGAGLMAKESKVEKKETKRGSTNAKHNRKK